MGRVCFRVSSYSGLSRLKRPRPYPVVFSGMIFCLAGRMGEFWVTGGRIGESRIFQMVESLAFLSVPSRRGLVISDRLQFGACSGRFTLARRTGLLSPVTQSPLSCLETRLSYSKGSAGLAVEGPGGTSPKELFYELDVFEVLERVVPCQEFCSQP